MSAETMAGTDPWIDLRRTHPEASRTLAAPARTGHLDPITLELVKVRASQINGCATCTAGHVGIARRNGETEARIDALPRWRDSDLFDDRERAALGLTEALTQIATQGPPPEDVVADAARHFPDEQLANLIMAITGINAWNRVALTAVMGRAGTPGE